MDARLFLPLLMLCAVASDAHTLHLGRTCPPVSPFLNLSLNKILGNWYVAYKFDTSNTCLMWNLTRSPDSREQLLLTEIRQLSALDLLGVEHTHAVTAKIDIPNPEVPAKMRIRWPTSVTGKADFIVFDTDYDNYLAVFECDRAGLLHRRSVAILSKERTLDDRFVNRVRRLLETVDVPHGLLTPISHKLCRDPDAVANKWHIKDELFGLIPQRQKQEQKQPLGENVQDYDISEIEIIGDGISARDGSFQGSLKEPPTL